MNTPASEAALIGSLQAINHYLDNGQDPNFKYPYNLTLLHKAAMNGNLECVQCLVQRGSNVESRDITGRTALHHAAGNGHLTVVKWLIDVGQADFQCKTVKGRTPQIVAGKHGHRKVVTFLNETEMRLTGSDWVSSAFTCKQ